MILFCFHMVCYVCNHLCYWLFRKGSDNEQSYKVLPLKKVSHKGTSGKVVHLYL